MSSIIKFKICIIIFLVILVLCSFNYVKEKFQVIVSFPYVISRKKTVIGNGSINGIKDGDLLVSGTSVSKNVCIEDDDNRVGNCINSGMMNKIKNGIHHYGDKICIDNENSRKICLTEQDAKFLKGLVPHLSMKAIEMKRKMIKTKPYCNWRGNRYFCGHGGYWEDDMIMGCYNNRLTYIIYNPTNMADLKGKKKRLNELT